MPHGKICYLEIPASDVDAAAALYAKVFGWQARVRDEGHAEPHHGKRRCSLPTP